MVAVVSFRAEDILEAYVVGSDIMEERKGAAVDIDQTFEIKTDLNYLFGAHGDGVNNPVVKMPFQSTDSPETENAAQTINDPFYDSSGSLLSDRGGEVRKRIGVLLQKLQEMTLYSERYSTSNMREAMNHQLVNLFQDHDLQGPDGDANIKINGQSVNRGLLQFKQDEIDEFVQSNSYRNQSTAFGNEVTGARGLATAIFTGAQTCQLLQAASVLRKDIVDDGSNPKYAKLKLVDGDKLSCIVKVNATDNDEYDENEDNSQHWEISFVQTTNTTTEGQIDTFISSSYADYSL